MVIGDQKNAIESMDITSIGAGGGSIGWLDRLGVLRVDLQAPVLIRVQPVTARVAVAYRDGCGCGFRVYSNGLLFGRYDFARQKLAEKSHQ